MDQAVQVAMARWPNVPDCYGWLHLDGRGHWRIGPERALVQHEGLRAFIGRNYHCDSFGRWFFQNGPQRVFVSLEAAPWILSFSPEESDFITHTGQELPPPDTLWLDNTGQLYTTTGLGPARICDRDLGALLAGIAPFPHPCSPEVFLEAWETLPAAGSLSALLQGGIIALGRIRGDPANHLGFVRTPKQKDENE